ncbi:MAG: hypothetical protein AB1442_16145 [Nitrospirota bacterium]
MARRAVAYKSEKRKKELLRLKKREEKRLRRIGKGGEKVSDEKPSEEGQPEDPECAAGEGDIT